MNHLRKIKILNVNKTPKKTTEMIQFLLNNLLKASGSYSVEENKIYRNLPFGFSYCCKECKLTMEACRIAYQLNSLPFLNHIV